jgi:tetratricopeptide (TPR) repeat protein
LWADIAHFIDFGVLADGDGVVTGQREGTWMHEEQSGRYELLCPLGQGGMGVVHLARDGDGRIVALKRMHDFIAAQDFGQKRFEREVAALRRVDSPHVAAIIDADLAGPIPYLATTYVQGRSLQQIVQERGPLGADELAKLGLGLAGALEAIHQARLVHRDIKPHNIMMANDEPVVIDLGIALLTDVTRITTGQIGTLEYMAPEILENKAVGAAADVFAWGAVMVFAATGLSCFAADSRGAVMHRVLSQEPDLTGVPSGLRDIVGRALAKDPQQRPSVRSLSEASNRLPQIETFQTAYRRAAELHEYGRAEGIAFGTHAIAVAAGDEVLAARSLLDQANSARYSGAFDRAENLYERARKAAADVGARGDEGWAVDGIGVCQNKREAFDLAELSFSAALAIAEEVGDAQLRAWNLCNLGDYARRREDLPSALQLYEQARTVAPDHLDIAIHAFSNSGHCERSLGDAESAEASFEQARQIAERIESPNAIAWAWFDLGECARDRHDHGRAKEAYENALGLATQNGHKDAEGWSLCKLASTIRETGDKERAAHLYRQAHQLGTFLDDQNIKTYAAERLAQLDPTWRP